MSEKLNDSEEYERGLSCAELMVGYDFENSIQHNTYHQGDGDNQGSNEEDISWPERGMTYAERGWNISIPPFHFLRILGEKNKIVE